MSSSSSTRRAGTHHRRSKTSNRALLVTHVLNAIFCFIAASFFTSIIPVWNGNFFHNSGIVRGDWPDCLPIIPLLLTLTGSLVYLIKLTLSRYPTSSQTGDYLKSRSKKTSSSTTSSKAHIYLTLTTLILLLTFLILAGVSGLYRFWRPVIISSSVKLSSTTASSTSLSALNLSRSISESNPTDLTPPVGGPSSASPTQNQKANLDACTLANIFTRRCNPTLYLIGDLQIAAIVAGALVWLINLALLILQVRYYQHQKRRHQKSLRAKAKAKLDFIEDDISKAEKGGSPVTKKIHYERRQRHYKHPSIPQPSSMTASNTSSSTVTRPKPARTNTGDSLDASHSTMRPKQHYYNPEITPSRSRSASEGGHGDISSNRSGPPSKTPYGRIVEEARRKVKPAETMRDWLAVREK